MSTQLNSESNEWPSSLSKRLGDGGFQMLYVLGHAGLLKHSFLALLCSVKCPGKAILQAYDLARSLRERNVPVIGGFHSPMEKECLEILLQGEGPIVLCPARSLPKRIPAVWQELMKTGRLTIVSPFNDTVKRTTEQTALLRNRLVAALADKIFVAHAAPNSKTESFCREILSWEKPVYTLELPENSNLLRLGAAPVSAASISAGLHEL